MDGELNLLGEATTDDVTGLDFVGIIDEREEPARSEAGRVMVGLEEGVCCFLFFFGEAATAVIAFNVLVMVMMLAMG